MESYVTKKIPLYDLTGDDEVKVQITPVPKKVVVKKEKETDPGWIKKKSKTEIPAQDKVEEYAPEFCNLFLKKKKSSKEIPVKKEEVPIKEEETPVIEEPESYGLVNWDDVIDSETSEGEPSESEDFTNPDGSMTNERSRRIIKPSRDQIAMNDDPSSSDDSDFFLEDQTDSDEEKYMDEKDRDGYVSGEMEEGLLPDEDENSIPEIFDLEGLRSTKRKSEAVANAILENQIRVNKRPKLLDDLFAKYQKKDPHGEKELKKLEETYNIVLPSEMKGSTIPLLQKKIDVPHRITPEQVKIRPVSTIDGAPKEDTKDLKTSGGFKFAYKTPEFYEAAKALSWISLRPGPAPVAQRYSQSQLPSTYSDLANAITITGINLQQAVEKLTQALLDCEINLAAHYANILYVAHYSLKWDCVMDFEEFKSHHIARSIAAKNPDVLLSSPENLIWGSFYAVLLEGESPDNLLIHLNYLHGKCENTTKKRLALFAGILVVCKRSSVSIPIARADEETQKNNLTFPFALAEVDVVKKTLKSAGYSLEEGNLEETLISCGQILRGEGITRREVLAVREKKSKVEKKPKPKKEKKKNPMDDHVPILLERDPTDRTGEYDVLTDRLRTKKNQAAIWTPSDPIFNALSFVGPYTLKDLTNYIYKIELLKSFGVEAVEMGNGPVYKFGDSYFLAISVNAGSPPSEWFYKASVSKEKGTVNGAAGGIERLIAKQESMGFKDARTLAVDNEKREDFEESQFATLADIFKKCHHDLLCLHTVGADVTANDIKIINDKVFVTFVGGTASRPLSDSRGNVEWLDFLLLGNKGLQTIAASINSAIFDDKKRLLDKFTKLWIDIGAKKSVAEEVFEKWGTTKRRSVTAKLDDLVGAIKSLEHKHVKSLLKFVVDEGSEEEGSGEEEGSEEEDIPIE